MPTVTHYSQPEFPPVLRWQVIAFMRVEWPFVFRGAGRFAEHPYPPEVGPLHVAAAAGDSLVSYATLLPLDLEHAGAAYRVYGLGNMFTFPPYRREGHGQRVLAYATALIRRSGADLGLLFCDPALEPFYAACGWEAVRQPTYVGPPGQQHPHEALTMALGVSERGRAGRAALDREPLCVAEAW